MNEQEVQEWAKAIKAGNVIIIPHEKLTPKPFKSKDWKFCNERNTFFHIDENGNKVFMTDQEWDNFNFWLSQWL